MLIVLPWQPALAWRMEADKVTINATTGGVITRINFRQTYAQVPLVFILPTNRGANPAALRLENITTAGFDVYMVEPDGNDGPHIDLLDVPYIAIEPGDYTLLDGTRFYAGTLDTLRYRSKLLGGASWDSVALTGFTTTPIVLAQIQTMNNESNNPPANVSQPWMTATVSNVLSSGFDIALERSETTTGTLNQVETIAYLVLESGTSNTSFVDNLAKTIELETIRSADNIRGWDNSATGYTVSFSKSYPDPIAVATKNTRDGGDGGWFRRTGISAGSMALVVDEDIATDSERSHTTEVAGVLVFSEPFDLNLALPEINLKKTSTVVFDPSNDISNPKRIPGSIVEFNIEALNTGEGTTDPDKLYITDTIPANLKLCVQDINVCRAPRFEDSDADSGLTLNVFEYSNDDGQTFTYSPTADAQGYDTAVTTLRMKLNGRFSANNGSNSPDFNLYLQMGVL